MARIVEHLLAKESKARHRAAQGAAKAQHLLAIWLLGQGRIVLQVVGVLAFVPRWVKQQLAARYRDRSRSARPRTTAVRSVLAVAAAPKIFPARLAGMWMAPSVRACRMGRQSGRDLSRLGPNRTAGMLRCRARWGSRPRRAATLCRSALAPRSASRTMQGRGLDLGAGRPWRPVGSWPGVDAQGCPPSAPGRPPIRKSSRRSAASCPHRNAGV